MAKNRRGVILNVTSFAQAGGPDLSAYNASKGAIASLTYSWALELAPFGIGVNALSPSGDTRMTQLLNQGRAQPSFYQDPAAAAPIACYLVSDHAKNVTGQVLRLTQETLQIHSHPGPWREATRTGGWTLEDIIREFPATLGKELHPIGPGATAYQFYGGLR
jgi:3-oxoacyl-[acyl-carrier protein] reductase